MLLFNSIKWMKRDLKFGLILEKEEEEGGRKMRKRVGMKWLRLSAALIWYSWYFALKSMLPSKPGSFVTPPLPQKQFPQFWRNCFHWFNYLCIAKLLKNVVEFLSRKTFRCFGKGEKPAQRGMQMIEWSSTMLFEIGQISFTLHSSTYSFDSSSSLYFFGVITYLLETYHFATNYLQRKPWIFFTLLFCLLFYR